MTRIIAIFFAGLGMLFIMFPPQSLSLTQMYTKPEVQQWDTAPPLTIDLNRNYKARIMTDKGVIDLELKPKLAPQAVNNFIFLARQNFYHNLEFYKVVKDFIIAAGDPWETGRGGPGYSINTELTTGEYRRGVIALANRGPNTNGSIFFIVHKDTNWPKQYTIIGKIPESDEKSFAVLDEIAQTSVSKNEYRELAQPLTPPVINSVVISEE